MLINGFYRQVYTCSECGEAFTVDPEKFYKWVLSSKFPVRCFNCERQEDEKSCRKCSICGNRVPEWDKSKDSLCKECIEQSIALDWRWLINSENSRARKFGLQGSLTISEWEVALRYFGGLCAYCETSWIECIEHFIPLKFQELGTEISNCVPSCNSCNSIKRDTHPLKGLISVKNTTRIVEYFKVAPTISLAQLRTKGIVGRVYAPNLFRTYRVKVSGDLYKVGVKSDFNLDGYVASVMGFHCETEGYTHEECLENIKEAIHFHIEAYSDMSAIADQQLSTMRRRGGNSFAALEAAIQRSQK